MFKECKKFFDCIRGKKEKKKTEHEIQMDRVVENKCPKCEITISSSQWFCPSCGEQLLKACDFCRHSFSPVFHFCDHCGKRREESIILSVV